MKIELTWHARNGDAPEPQGLVAQGALAHKLLARLEELDEADLARLAASACRDFLVLLGPAALLPWLDGVRYCAPSANVPALWLPTHLEPGLAHDLLHTALSKRVGQNCGPLLLWPEPEQIFPLNHMLNLNPACLSWLSKVL